MVILSILFLQQATYARVEVVKGDIDTDPGSAIVVPSRAGTITNVLVADRSSVHKGQPIATIRTEDAGLEGASGSQAALATLRRQDEQLRYQGHEVSSSSTGTLARLAAQTDGQARELAALDEQISAQRRLVATAKDDLERVQGLVRRGFVSRRDAQAREDTVSSRVQQLAALVQAHAEKAAAMAQTKRGIEEARHQARGANAEVEAQRAAVERIKSDVAAMQGYTLAAPINGTITALTARIGQPTNQTASLMTIVPSHARLYARLYVPTRSSGFLDIGQEVRLGIDAFPYAKFGTIPARIETISTATISTPSSNEQIEPVYLVTASINEPWVAAFGRRRTLQPGMTLSARILTEKRSLIEWLFEPVLAIRRR